MLLLRASPLLAVVLCSPLFAEWNVVLHEGRRYVTIENVAEFYRMTVEASSGPDFRLAAPGRSIVGRAGARDIRINGVKYVLCFPMASKDGRTIISAMDVTKIIEPVLRPQKIQNATAVKTVVLDPGHGGHDSGAKGPFGKEKDAALDVALRAKKLLEAQGYTVRMTRTTDVFVPLEERARFANRFPNAVFVSIHFNKSRSNAGTGIETYCLAPRGVPSMDEENLSYSDYKLHPGHARDPENIALATAVHASMVRKINLPDRGIKRARFHVIRETQIPGILLEGGFMNHPVDARLIASPIFRQQMAGAILAGVNTFRGAVAGNPVLPKPSAVASAADPTSVPSLVNRTIGADADASRAIEAAARSLTN
ncbi:MAG: N-acetylmuramoyl-L-alanine amidase [Terrimicrobiaceae bacterium]|nr:N-acetylmuramoyl-L-alanine amidase [Terrimicrobiaceae bacterium]